MSVCVRDFFSLFVLFLVFFCFSFFAHKTSKVCTTDECMLVPSFERNQYTYICVCMSGKFNFERFVSWLDLIYFRTNICLSVSVCFFLWGRKVTNSLIHTFIHWVRLRRINEAHISFFTDSCKRKKERNAKRTHKYKQKANWIFSSTAEDTTQTHTLNTGPSLKTGKKWKKNIKRVKKSADFDTSIMWFYSQKK